MEHACLQSIVYHQFTWFWPIIVQPVCKWSNLLITVLPGHRSQKLFYLDTDLQNCYTWTQISKTVLLWYRSPKLCYLDSDLQNCSTWTQISKLVTTTIFSADLLHAFPSLQSELLRHVPLALSFVWCSWCTAFYLRSTDWCWFARRMSTTCVCVCVGGWQGYWPAVVCLANIRSVPAVLSSGRSWPPTARDCTSAQN